MKFMKKFLFGLMLTSLLLENIDLTFHTSYIINTTEAHSGRTDSSGGHKDNKNKSGLGYYHYHCGGNPPHLHKNGVCPYDSISSESKTTITDQSPKEDSIASSKTEEVKITKSIIKKVQKALKELGYSCGKLDGKMGKSTKNALKLYQEDHYLNEDGIIGVEVLEALDIEYN